MWSSIEEFLWGSQVSRATEDPELKEVKKYSRKWSFSVPRASDLVICDPDTHGCLYMGGILAFVDPAFVQEMNAVVTVIDSERVPKSDFDLPRHISHLYIDADDSLRTDLTPHFNKTYRFIDMHMAKGHKIFVNCMVGKSRSATIVLYYIMRKYKLPLLQALKYLKSRRPPAQPNEAFLEQLLNVQQQQQQQQHN